MWQQVKRGFVFAFSQLKNEWGSRFTYNCHSFGEDTLLIVKQGDLRPIGSLVYNPEKLSIESSYDSMRVSRQDTIRLDVRGRQVVFAGGFKVLDYITLIMTDFQPEQPVEENQRLKCALEKINRDEQPGQATIRQLADRGYIFAQKVASTGMTVRDRYLALSITALGRKFLHR